MEVSLARGAPVKARMRTQSVVEVEILAQRRAGLSDRVVGIETYLLVFHASPQPLDSKRASEAVQARDLKFQGISASMSLLGKRLAMRSNVSLAQA